MGLFLFRVRSDFGLALRVFERPEFVSDAACDGREFAASLEAREIRPVEPADGTAEPFVLRDRRIVHDVD